VVLRLIIGEPGHFHAALVQKEMYPWLDERASVYGTLGPDLLDYLRRISLFNSRAAQPTRWQLDVHTSPDPIPEMCRDRAGDIVVYAGRNLPKIDRILAALRAGFHVLADKPWIIRSADLPKLAEALALAERNHLAAYDIMTERYEVTSQLQRELVSTPEIFGEPESVSARSVHHVMKKVAGIPARRPPWFFDVADYGEGLADVGTHVVDLIQWTLFPDQAIECREIQLLGGHRWPLVLSAEQLAAVTGEPWIGPAPQHYYCNNSVEYRLRGVPVQMEITWEWEAPPGRGDIYEAAFRGTRSHIEIRQGDTESHIPELYIVPRVAGVAAEVEATVAALRSRWPGLAVNASGGELRLAIPPEFRVGHEAHFGQVTNRFFQYVTDPASMPAWETPFMLAKYYVSTRGTEMGNQ
jgi:predicted dehydrogenase